MIPFWYRPPMEIRHLRYFLAVAEELHFGRAARRLHMSQPPLSKRIADLERELDVRLFDRSNRHVALTASGRRLMPKARRAVAAFDAAADSVRGTAGTCPDRIRVAFPPDTSREVLVDLASALRSADADANLAEATTAEQHAQLLAGDIDVGVLRHPYNPRNLRSSPQLYQTLGVVTAADHPLAGRPQLRLEDLNGYTLVMFPRSMAPGMYDDILGTCKAGGYWPARIEPGVRMVGGLLAADTAVTFNTSHAFSTTGAVGVYPGLIWIPLTGEPLRWRTSVVCHRLDRKPLTRTAVQVIARALQQHDHWLRS
jgi:DNA-binding transcriptional LysR family regulator